MNDNESVKQTYTVLAKTFVEVDLQFSIRAESKEGAQVIAERLIATKDIGNFSVSPDQGYNETRVIKTIGREDGIIVEPGDIIMNEEQGLREFVCCETDIEFIELDEDAAAAE